MAEHLIILSNEKEELLSLWNQYHDEYSNIVNDYWQLIDEKKRLKLRLEQTIKRSDIRHEFPDIPFLRASSEAEAICQLVKMSGSDVRFLKNKILALTENESSIFHRLRKANRYSRLQIQRAGKPKTYISYGGGDIISNGEA